MATEVQLVCKSPRHQPQLGELSTGSAIGSSCLATCRNKHSHQSPHLHTNLQQSTVGGAARTTAPIYSSISKHLRPHIATQMQTNPHIYDGSARSVNNAFSYGSTLNQMSHNSMDSPPTVLLQQQQQHGSVQFSCSNTSAVPTAADEYRNYWSHKHAAALTHGGTTGRGSRKTAVQILAETKPLFMKSDAKRNLLDRFSFAAPPSSPAGYRNAFLSTPVTNVRRGRSSNAPSTHRYSSYTATSLGHVTSAKIDYGFPTRPPNNGQDSTGAHNFHTHMPQNSLPLAHSKPFTNQTHHIHSQVNRNGAPTCSGGNMLQTKYKFLIPPEIARERDRDRLLLGGQNSDILLNFDCCDSIGLKNCVGETSMQYMRNDDVMTIPPNLFPASHNYEHDYSYGRGNSSSNIDEQIILTEDYRPISPPAEYAVEKLHTNIEGHRRYNYQRSFSHSHEVRAEDEKYTADAYNINSHKSMPDLHSQISRHSPHSEILSCCSRGNRSNKSAGESSLNRDSGGSSGHYTHRSEPCYRQHECEHESYDSEKPVCCSHANTAAYIDIRRDSGSSTQHSANSYCGYGSPAMYERTAAECVACRCNRNLPTYDASCDYLPYVPTPVVPEEFQDDYIPPSQSQALSTVQNCEQRTYSSSSQRHPMYHQQQQQQERQQQKNQEQQPYSQFLPPQAAYLNIRDRPNYCNPQQSFDSMPPMEDISPPPIEFKRQKCIRFKNRNRLPARNMEPLRNNTAGTISNGGNASINSDDYCRLKSSGCGNTHRSSSKRSQNSAIGISANLPPLPPLPSVYDASGINQVCFNYASEGANDEFSSLERFFDRMGLNEDNFNGVFTAGKRCGGAATTNSDDSSVVFFSDVSTVDSMRLADSTETQMQNSQYYRPTEPPSIVERNARIIKWLVNIKKLEQPK